MQTATSFTADDLAVYLTDNGAAYCGKHLGASARYTGRDISGQPILRVTPRMADVKIYPDESLTYGPIACEICGREAGR